MAQRKIQVNGVWLPGLRHQGDRHKQRATEHTEPQRYTAPHTATLATWPYVAVCGHKRPHGATTETCGMQFKIPERSMSPWHLSQFTELDVARLGAAHADLVECSIPPEFFIVYRKTTSACHLHHLPSSRAAMRYDSSRVDAKTALSPTFGTPECPFQNKTQTRAGE